MSDNEIAVKGLLLHINHRGPGWDPIQGGKGEREDPNAPRFDIDTALRVVDAMAEAGMNLLVVDCADGVRYKSRPELRRPYSVPMSQLKKLAAHAHDAGLDVAPKLNFSKSGRNQHDMWMGPYSGVVRWMPAYKDEYWKVADDLIGELVDVCEPKAYFHIGMDEDHYRSLPQFVEAIKRLRSLVRKRGLRTVAWSDACHDEKEKIAQVHAQKCKAAEPMLPRDIVQVLWDYRRAHASDVKRLADQGFAVWAAPGREPHLVKNWRRALLSNGGEGFLMTKWVKCDKSNEKDLIEMVTSLGPLL